MNKKTKYLILIILVVAVLVGYYLYYNRDAYDDLRADCLNNFTSQEKCRELGLPTADSLFQGTDTSDAYEESEELHWTHMPVSYQIYNCTEYQGNRVIRAFNKIQEETNNTISFAESEEEGFDEDIIVMCYEEYKHSEEVGFDIAGDSIYYPYEDYPDKIYYAVINFYGITKTTYSSGCTTYPDVEIHEILHAFGFEHVSNPNHIMNPAHTYCPTHLNQDTLETLMRIYSLNEEPVETYEEVETKQLTKEDYDKIYEDLNERLNKSGIG